MDELKQLEEKRRAAAEFGPGEHEPKVSAPEPPPAAGAGPGPCPAGDERIGAAPPSGKPFTAARRNDAPESREQKKADSRLTRRRLCTIIVALLRLGPCGPQQSERTVEGFIVHSGSRARRGYDPFRARALAESADCRTLRRPHLGPGFPGKRPGSS